MVLEPENLPPLLRRAVLALLALFVAVVWGAILIGVLGGL